jgi:hypothetical protein
MARPMSRPPPVTSAVFPVIAKDMGRTFSKGGSGGTKIEAGAQPRRMSALEVAGDAMPGA